MTLPDIFASIGSAADLPDLSRVATERRHTAAAQVGTGSVEDDLALFSKLDREAVNAVADATPQIAALLEAARPGYLRGGRVFYLGAGTSGRLGVIDAAECIPTFNVETFVGIIAGGPDAMTRAAEMREDDPHGAHEALRGHDLTDRDLVIGITASDRTPYVLGGLEFARSFGALTCLLCNSRPAEDDCADHVICVETGPEIPAGSTRMKAGTAQNLVLKRISTLLNVNAGNVFRGVMVNVRPSNAKLVARAVGIISLFTGEGRDEALNLLRGADGNVKVALVMHFLMCTSDQARNDLARYSGQLEPIIGDAVTRVLTGSRS